MSHTYDKYLEHQMPADPVRELELSIKKERQDEIAAQIKSEPRFDIPEKKRRNPNQTFKCRICPAEFKSKYAFTVHFNKEMILSKSHIFSWFESGIHGPPVSKFWSWTTRLRSKSMNKLTIN